MSPSHCRISNHNPVSAARNGTKAPKSSEARGDRYRKDRRRIIYHEKVNKLALKGHLQKQKAAIN